MDSILLAVGIAAIISIGVLLRWRSRKAGEPFSIASFGVEVGPDGEKEIAAACKIFGAQVKWSFALLWGSTAAAALLGLSVGIRIAVKETVEFGAVVGLAALFADLLMLRRSLSLYSAARTEYREARGGLTASMSGTALGGQSRGTTKEREAGAEHH